MKRFNPLSSVGLLLQPVMEQINLKKLAPGCLLLLCCIKAPAQKKDQQTSTTGYVNFNVQSNSQKSTARQPLSLYACNTRITMADSAYWHGSKGLKWDSVNQVLSGIPYGYQTDAGAKKRYYISKYYIASPPVFDTTNAGKSTIYDIGLVTPDEFVLRGEKPAQLVYLNYNVLEPMYIKYFDVKFDPSFRRLGHSLVPFKVECNDFPWSDKKQLPGAKGASGIGALDMNSTKPQKLFLPYYFKSPAAGDTTYLDCQVTILNDILFRHEIFFIVKGKGKQKNDTLSTINLRNYKNTKDTIELYCKFRNDLPCGCLEPKAGK